MDKQTAKTNASRTNTLQELAERWIAADIAHKSEGWQHNVVNWLKLDIYPALGKRDPRSIRESDVRQLIAKIEARGAPASANKVRTICRQIFAYAKRKGEVDSNPVTDVERVEERNKQSHRALAVKEIGSFLRALQRDRGRETNKLAIRLLMLTLVRKDELRLATWKEFDFENKVWDIPAHRMKMRQAHRVYLSTQACDLLVRLQELGSSSEYILPNYTSMSRPMGHTTINSVIDRLEIHGARFVPHGFRATASSILNERGFRSEVIERALAHGERNQVRAIYNQAEYAQERTEMLQWWADYVDSLECGGTVIPVRFGRS